MNQKSLYEQLLAEKLEQIVCTDQSDHIWNLVERQLSLELPVNTSSKLVKKRAYSKNFIFWSIMGITTLFVLIVFVMVHTGKQETVNRVDHSTPKLNKQVHVVINDSTNSVKDKKSKLIKPIVLPNNNFLIPRNKRNTVPLSHSIDTEFYLEPLKVSRQPLYFPVKDSVFPKKKSIGIKGVTDKDYRIIIKKDSIK